MLDFRYKIFVFLTLILGISACGLTTKEQTKMEEPKEYVGSISPAHPDGVHPAERVKQTLWPRIEVAHGRHRLYSLQRNGPNGGGGGIRVLWAVAYPCIKDQGSIRRFGFALPGHVRGIDQRQAASLRGPRENGPAASRR